MFHQDGFPGAGRGDDEGALSFAERCDEIDGAGAEGWFFDGLEQDAFLREEGSQFVERGGCLPFGGRDALDGGDVCQTAVAVAVAGHPQRAGDVQTRLQAELPDKSDGDEQVVRSASQIIARPTQHGVVAHVLDHAIAGDGGAGREEKAAEVKDEVALGAVRAQAQGIPLDQFDQRGMRQGLEAGDRK